MLRLIIWAVVILLAFVSLFFTREDPVLTEVRKRYAVLSQDPPNGMEQLSKKTLITGFREKYGEIGYNVNKGDEIGLCLDGSANEVFHVLLHELAHTVTKSYSHNEEFWKNYNTLKHHCIQKGIYVAIPEKTEFCGKFIRD